MHENHKPQPHSFEQKLEKIRAHIDECDQLIVQTLKQRLVYVQSVGELKRQSGVVGSYIRPDREIKMLRELIIQLKDTYPAEAVESVWRTIIGASTATEAPLMLHAVGQRAAMLGQHYFGAFIPLCNVPDVATALEAARANPHAVAVFDVQDVTHWQAHYPGIFARIPFVGDSSVVAAAQAPYASTGNDVTLVWDAGVRRVEGWHPSPESGILMGAYGVL